MVCTLCRGNGIILKGEVAVPCPCTQHKSIKRLLKDSCLPERLLYCTLENFNFQYYSKCSRDTEIGISYYDLARLAYQATENFINNFAKNPNADGILFTGQVGSGKTFLACCIANALLKKGKPILFAVVPDLLDQIRSTYDFARNSEVITEFDILDKAKQAPLLILDDLGVHNYTEWTKNKIYSILNYRLNQRLPVIVTTNIIPEELEQYLGERTTSRLLEMCKPYRLLVDIDIRAVQRKEKDCANLK
jgi:DNA replication protein DnaC